MTNPTLTERWLDLPTGAQAALAVQWTGLAVGGLPCGAAVTDTAGNVITIGRNHAYDHPDSSVPDDEPLQFTRLAHAELNAIARLPSDGDHASLTVWSTQHPCAMCAAAIAFTGIGSVIYIADDLSDDAPADVRDATRAGVPYTALNDPFWWTVSNLLFVYGSVVMRGPDCANLVSCREHAPRLADLVLRLAADNELGQMARDGNTLVAALDPYLDALLHASEQTL